jgi:hypothetical protein
VGKRLGLILMGLAAIAGLGGGLLYTWVLDAPEAYDSSPDALRQRDKLVYLTLIGDLYADEGDLVRARDRLAELDVKADGSTLAGFIEAYLDQGGSPEEVRNLARLAEDLGARGGVLLVFESVSTPTSSPTPTRPANTDVEPSPPPSPTLAPTFRLADRTSVCAEPGQPGKIIVWVYDREGNGLPGVEIVASWGLNQNHFFTGLRPELGMGYADFQMQPETEYDVALAGFQGDTATGLISDLSPGICPTGTLAVSWQLTFEQK